MVLLSKVYPQAKQQRCWVHKAARVLNKLPKTVQLKANEALHNIWMAETCENAVIQRLQDLLLGTRALDCLVKDRDSILVFYNFPAERWALYTRPVRF